MMTLTESKFLEEYSLVDDLLFKETMAREINRAGLIRLLHVFTKLPEEYIKNNLNVSYESQFGKNTVLEKSMAGDIIIRIKDHLVNIEMYKYLDKEGVLKSTCYAMKLFSTELKTGEKYSNLKNMIQINIVKNVRIKFSRKFESIYNVNEVDDNETLCDKFQIKYYRIDKADELLYNQNEEVKWIKFINASSYLERKKIAEGDEIMEKLNENINEFILDDETRKEFARFRYENQMKLHKKEGHRDGLLQVAKNMLESNMPVDQIKKFTGLSLKEIKNL